MSDKNQFLDKTGLDNLISKIKTATENDTGALVEVAENLLYAVPAQSTDLYYTGSSQSPTWDSNYDADKIDVSGDTAESAIGTYTATFTPKTGYQWYDSSTSKTNTWKIKAIPVEIPYQSESLLADGTEQSPTWTNYDSSKMTISGDTVGTDAGTYTAVFTLNANYIWSDGDSNPKYVYWKISGDIVDLGNMEEASF